MEAEFPPAAAIAVLARALEVSTDELLGVKPLKEKGGGTPGDERLWRRFQQIRALPERDQRAILRMVGAVVTARGERTTGQRSGARPALRSG